MAKRVVTEADLDRELGIPSARPGLDADARCVRALVAPRALTRLRAHARTHTRTHARTHARTRKHTHSLMHVHLSNRHQGRERAERRRSRASSPAARQARAGGLALAAPAFANARLHIWTGGHDREIRGQVSHRASASCCQGERACGNSGHVGGT
jgi:hypothetical protein